MYFSDSEMSSFSPQVQREIRYYQDIVIQKENELIELIKGQELLIFEVRLNYFNDSFVLSTFNKFETWIM